MDESCTWGSPWRCSGIDAPGNLASPSSKLSNLILALAKGFEGHICLPPRRLWVWGS